MHIKPITLEDTLEVLPDSHFNRWLYLDNNTPIFLFALALNNDEAIDISQELSFYKKCYPRGVMVSFFNGVVDTIYPIQPDKIRTSTSLVSLYGNKCERFIKLDVRRKMATLTECNLIVDSFLPTIDLLRSVKDGEEYVSVFKNRNTKLIKI